MIMVRFLSLSYETLVSSISYKVLLFWANSVWTPIVPLLSGIAGPLLWELVYHCHHCPPSPTSEAILSLHILASWARDDLPIGEQILQAGPIIVLLELELVDESKSLSSGGRNWMWQLAHAPYRWRRPVYGLQLYEILWYSSNTFSIFLKLSLLLLIKEPWQMYICSSIFLSSHEISTTEPSICDG